MNKKEPGSSTQCLGCKHHVERDQDGINKITYDMEDFLAQSIQRYLKLCVADSARTGAKPSSNSSPRQVEGLL